MTSGGRLTAALAGGDPVDIRARAGELLAPFCGSATETRGTVVSP